MYFMYRARIGQGFSKPVGIMPYKAFAGFTLIAMEFGLQIWYDMPDAMN